MIQVTSSLVVTSDKINACSVYTQQAYLRAARVSVSPRPRDQLNAKGADVRHYQTDTDLDHSFHFFFCYWENFQGPNSLQ